MHSGFFPFAAQVGGLRKQAMLLAAMAATMPYHTKYHGVPCHICGEEQSRVCKEGYTRYRGKGLMYVPAQAGFGDR